MKLNFSFWVLGDKTHIHQIQDFINEGVHAQLLSHVRLFEVLLIVASQVPFIWFSRSGLPFPTPRDLPDPGNRTHVPCHSCIGRRILYFWAMWDAINEDAAAAKLLQPCPTLCNPIDGSPPGSSVPGILQARILEWASISFSHKWGQLFSNVVWGFLDRCGMVSGWPELFQGSCSFLCVLKLCF